MGQTLDQKRAADAWHKVDNILHRYTDENWQDRYASYVVNLPATILNCGLGQAAATLLAAAGRTNDQRKDPHRVLYDHLQNWLCRDEPEAPYRSSHDLLQAIIEHDRVAYMKAQAEALAWLNWLKKLAVAYLKKEAGGQ